MSVGPRHRASSWCMLAAVIFAIAVLVGFGIYSTVESGTGQEGQGAPVQAGRSTP